jgi:hypothetical protein
VTILIGQYAGHVTATSTDTGQIGAYSRAEFARFLRLAKRGRYDYLLTPAGDPGPVAPAGTPPRPDVAGDPPGPGWLLSSRPGALPVDLSRWPRPDAPQPVEHRQVAGWKGGPGECGAECSCGETYDGFDSLGAACELLDRHIVRSNAMPVPPTTVREGL